MNENPEDLRLDDDLDDDLEDELTDDTIHVGEDGKQVLCPGCQRDVTLDLTMTGFGGGYSIYRGVCPECGQKIRVEKKGDDLPAPSFQSPVFSIVHHHDGETQRFFYRVELNSACEMWYEIFDERGEDLDQLMGDIFASALPIIQLDSDLAEAYDNAFRTKPSVAAQSKVVMFTEKYRDRFRGSNITFGGFPHTRH
ncbi:hypothetical protein [Deinococcus cellulosilyticus]|uniref:Uncharacterized protein n=1 Tax=Deinococcus cellulosilyticus (strain DSM 18568 / NBRC 106333 / KACC 11606 / 5516J-15) TaxID=1223518 RepID=A0A511NAW0_DEIC1|nr:hypothetical protein [Deinococcus cellulosilyticus]GEM49648.1 hypothetical protein DC3_52830 [Deinococcus cellulosilyticus NBRC 106333 = KACC 11606]